MGRQACLQTRSTRKSNPSGTLWKGMIRDLYVGQHFVNDMDYSVGGLEVSLLHVCSADLDSASKADLLDMACRSQESELRNQGPWKKASAQPFPQPTMGYPLLNV